LYLYRDPFRSVMFLFSGKALYCLSVCPCGIVNSHGVLGVYCTVFSI
jgi:hypothetical protein